MKQVWTTKYPTSSIHEMMNLLSLLRAQNLSGIKFPTLVIYTESDDTVDTDLIKSSFELLGSKNKKILQSKSKVHVLSGNFTSPETTDQTVNEITEFIRSLN